MPLFWFTGLTKPYHEQSKRQPFPLVFSAVIFEEFALVAPGNWPGLSTNSILLLPTGLPYLANSLPANDNCQTTGKMCLFSAQQS